MKKDQDLKDLDFAQAALALRGARFQEGGRSRHAHDCSGHTVLSMRACGLTVEDFTGVRPGCARSAAEIQRGLAKYCTPAAITCRDPGTILSVQIGTHDDARHLAICTFGHVVHSDQDFGTVQTLESGMGGQVVGAWRVKW